MSELYLAHHGIKGQKWGVRRYQNPDGTLTAAGKMRYGGFSGSIEGTSSGRKLKNDTLYRVQKEREFDDRYAFYATYKMHDVLKYRGLFGQNLQRRYGDVPVVSVSINVKDKLSVPSDNDCQKITGYLLKDEAYRNNYVKSIEHARDIMRRPQQTAVFNRALNDVKKGKYDSKSVYEALNLSLVNHTAHDNAVADSFYEVLRRNGYSALVDINDKKYSSYHAKEPLIVFDTNTVALQAVTDLNPKNIKLLNTVFNVERGIKESSNLSLLTSSVENAYTYVNKKIDGFLK